MRSLSILLALVVTALAYPAAAGALIQVNKGIAGARLNNTQAEVRAALGKPGRVIKRMNDFGPFTTFRYRGGITVHFQGRKRVTSVATKGLGDRTIQGVGVDSSEAEADALPGVKCETIAGTRSCHTGAFTPGRRVTDFLIRNDKVTRVTVGIVID